ncbi:hypothetical protein STEG23_001591 [Scotinomys teguina]
MPKADSRLYFGMRLSGQRSSPDANRHCGPVTGRSKRMLLPCAADQRVKLRLLLPLLLLCALQTPTTAVGNTEAALEVDLDLTPDSFDDQYQGCSKQVMEELSHGDYFLKEIGTHKYYSRAWQKAHLTWLSQDKTVPETMTTIHAVALLVFTLNRNVSSDFAMAMASAVGSPSQYRQSFHFKYLHYYLTSAIQLLRKESSTKNNSLCYRVHHGMKNVKFDVNVGDTIRFGQFLSASLLREETRVSGNQTLFTIVTCLGVPVQDFCLRKEVLIPPYELFEVTSKSHNPKGDLINLRSAGNLSTYNCQLLKASSKKCAPAPVVTVCLFLVSVVISSKNREQRDPLAPF